MTGWRVAKVAMVLCVWVKIIVKPKPLYPVNSYYNKMPFKDNQKQKDNHKEYDKSKTKEKKETFKCRPFEEVAREFEKTHAFIEMDGVYIAELDGDIQIMSYDKLMKMYKHITSKRKGFQGVKFISQWANSNDNIRKFRSMSSYPPPLLCPANVYNTWTPFYAQNLPKMEKNNIELHLFREQLFVLCNKQLDVFDYMEKWIAQFLQYPAEKTTCPVFVSQEGCGKGYFCNMLKRIVGDNKYLEVSDMKKVAGTFNGLSKNAFIINLNEATATQAKSLHATLKAIITDTECVIEQKGIDAVKCKNYSRVIITTNESMPIKLKKDNRRFVLIRSSNEKKGNNEYWEARFKEMKDDNLIYTLFRYYTNITQFPNMDKFRSIPIPRTEYSVDCLKANRNYVSLFIEYLAEDNLSNNITTDILLNETLYSKWLEWCEYADIPKKEVLTIIPFGV